MFVVARLFAASSLWCSIPATPAEHNALRAPRVAPRLCARRPAQRSAWGILQLDSGKKLRWRRASETVIRQHSMRSAMPQQRRGASQAEHHARSLDASDQLCIPSRQPMQRPTCPSCALSRGGRQSRHWGASGAHWLESVRGGGQAQTVAEAAARARTAGSYCRAQHPPWPRVPAMVLSSATPSLADGRSRASFALHRAISSTKHAGGSSGCTRATSPSASSPDISDVDRETVLVVRAARPAHTPSCQSPTPTCARSRSGTACGYLGLL
eukprot:3101072-Rhodomonas_salina.3